MTLQSYLDEVKERLAAATPGPWTNDYHKDQCSIDVKGEMLATTGDRDYFSSDPDRKTCQANARFIAACRTDVEKLLRIVEELSKGCDSVHLYVADRIADDKEKK